MLSFTSTDNMLHFAPQVLQLLQKTNNTAILSKFRNYSFLATFMENVANTEVSLKVNKKVYFIIVYSEEE